MAENERNNWLIISIIIMAVSIVLIVIFGIFGRRESGMMDGMMGSGWLMMLVPVGLIIFLIFALTDRIPDKYYVPESPPQALERRYARGEISRDEFLRIRDDLGYNRSDG